ncbi:LAME_0B07888g1_1 [Lachancea meyersii CBS 8951]|uniref:LAME_0B07888g1_1 n=1 Tax=Lachancea meyersii CBS 8951 TaxID=1266667 RepID=A0A1G4IXJ0_9SACH|nr:LAME_0B07888g1_1 [Lachancea meyersii CBS 8951]
MPAFIFGPRTGLVFYGIFLALLAQPAKCMDMDDTTEYTRPEIVEAGSKTFHWLCTMGLLLIVPSFAAVFSFAGKLYMSIFLQLVSLIYALVEALILRFPDADGVENRTSRGTAWFLIVLIGLTILFGSLASGTGALVHNKRLKSIVTKTGEHKLHISHRTLSFAVVLAGWVKTCLAPVAMFGFCRKVHTGQCIAHGVMGSAFVVYGFVYSMVLVIPWLRNNEGPYSQDRIDSWVMCAWGIVNTFTEHRWGREGWNHGDYQHTAMGIVWWAGGLLGIFLSRGGRRTFVPSLLIIFTGWAMSEHSQHLIISTKVHALFGLVLMSGGALRIIEISFLLKDRRSAGEIMSFQYLAPFCLVCSGILFMSANEEQLILVLRLGADHSAYSLVVISAAFVTYLWILLCLELYLRLVLASEKSPLTSYKVGDVTDFELDNLEEGSSSVGSRR